MRWKSLRNMPRYAQSMSRKADPAMASGLQQGQKNRSNQGACMDRRLEAILL